MKRLVPIVLLIAVAGAACRKAAAPQTQTTTTPPPASAEAPAAAAPAPGEQAPPKPMPTQLPAVLARVNGEPVERWEMETAIKRAEQQAGGTVPADQRDQVLRNVLDQLIAYHVLAQESRARKLDVPDAEVDQRLDDMRKAFKTPQAFQDGMASQGLTIDLLKKQTRLNLEAQRIIDLEVNEKVSVNDSDADTFYQQNLERFKEGESVRVAHILIGLPPSATAEQKAAARQRAEKVLETVKAQPKGDFAKFAHDFSDDQGTSSKGGDLGFVQRGQMVPALDDAVFKLKAGAISNLVETQFGFHIIKVSTHRAARTTPLAEVKPQILQFLTQGQRQSRLEQLVEQTKAKIKVEILV